MLNQFDIFQFLDFLSSQPSSISGSVVLLKEHLSLTDQSRTFTGHKSMHRIKLFTVEAGVDRTTIMN